MLIKTIFGLKSFLRGGHMQINACNCYLRTTVSGRWGLPLLLRAVYRAILGQTAQVSENESPPLSWDRRQALCPDFGLEAGVLACLGT